MADSQIYVSRSSISSDNILKPIIRLDSDGMRKYAFENHKVIATGLEIWMKQSPQDADPSDAEMLTAYNNTGCDALFALFPGGDLQPSERYEDIIAKALYTQELNLSQPTVTFRLDLSCEIGVDYIRDYHGNNTAPQVPLKRRILPDGTGAFLLKFQTLVNRPVAELVATSPSPDLRIGEVVISKSSAHFGAFIGLYKNNRLIHGGLMDRGSRRLTLYFPDVFCARWYSYRVRGVIEDSFGSAIAVEAGQICWLIQQTDGSLNPEVTDNTNLLYLPSVDELNVYQRAVCEDVNW